MCAAVNPEGSVSGTAKSCTENEGGPDVLTHELKDEFMARTSEAFSSADLRMKLLIHQPEDICLNIFFMTVRAGEEFLPNYFFPRELLKG